MPLAFIAGWKFGSPGHFRDARRVGIFLYADPLNPKAGAAGKRVTNGNLTLI